MVESAAGPRQINLGVFVAAVGNHVAGWRLPDASSDGEDFPALLEIARTAERGKLDFIFFADSPVCTPDGHPSFLFQLEPTTLLGALASCTSRIGLIATVSSTFTEPYNLARAMGSIDHISGGRAGWNVVTTSIPLAAANFGREIPEHDLRYEIADEYLQVVQGLWDSWDEGARVADKQTGQFSDRSKVHILDHKGRYFNVRGPLGLTRSRQGQPVIVQAGSSGAGQSFAAKHAEAVFTIQQDLGDAQRFYKGMKEKVAEAGRAPEHCRILPGLNPVIGRTEEEARAKFEQLAGTIQPGSALVSMSERFGHDMSQYPMDGPMPDLPESDNIKTFLAVMLAKARREGMTLREVHDFFALSRGYLLVRGTPASIADTIEEWVAGQACDGFMIVPSHFPGALDDFVGLVVPELQRRGLFRTEYEGTTLRSHLGLPVPENRFFGAKSGAS